jgi:flagellar biosynthesis/type III secretory pathway chaperone
MAASVKDIKEVHYFQITDLWRRLCEEHTTLFDQTCEEYAILLRSNLDELEVKVCEKEETISRIATLEQMRQEIIEEINKSDSKNISSVSDLISYMQDLVFERDQKHLHRFNMLLIDIIQKIQTQNKKNQMFINKALLSLRELRQDALGQKNYSTYTSKGGTRHATSV